MSRLPIKKVLDEQEKLTGTYISYCRGVPVTVYYHNQVLTVKPTPHSKQQIWSWQPETGILATEEGDYDGLLPILESLFGQIPLLDRIYLTLSASLQSLLLQSGMVHISPIGKMVISRDIFWQLNDLWLTFPSSPYPQQLIMGNAQCRHPIRPAKKTGTLYRRFIPWLSQTLSFRALDIKEDLIDFHRWMHNPQVAEFWQQADSCETLSDYLQTLEQDAHCQTIIGCFDEKPFAYFEIYWAKEDRIAPFYIPDDYDRGWHLLVGEEAYRGKDWFCAWFPSLQHYLFLDDSRTQRIVAEPRHDNIKLIRNAHKFGFGTIKTFEFPHKKAQLLMLLRENFFQGNHIHPSILL